MSAVEDPVIIPPSTRLQGKLGKGVKLRQLIQPEKLAAAEKLTDGAREEFLSLTRQDLRVMQQAIENGANAVTHSTLYEAAFRIKSRAGMFDYNLASAICRQLYTFIERRSQVTENDLPLITSHINALRAVFHANITGDGGKMGQELLENLVQLLNKHFSA